VYAFINNIKREGLLAVALGLLDGDGFRAIRRDKNGKRHYVGLSTVSYCESIIYSIITRKVLGKLPSFTVKYDPRYDRSEITIYLYNINTYNILSEEYLNKMSKSEPLYHLTGLVYAEGKLQHRWVKDRPILRDIRVYSKLRMKENNYRRTWQRLYITLNLMGFYYNVIPINDGLLFIISDKRGISMIMNTLPLNYKFFRYLWYNNRIDVTTFIVAYAFDYSILNRILTGCKKGDFKTYLDSFEIRLLEAIDVKLPRIRSCTSALNCLSILGIGTPYDVLSIVNRIFIKLRNKWFDIVNHAIEKIPKQVRKACERIISGEELCNNYIKLL